MQLHSLLKQGSYDRAWVNDFYAQAAIWWGPFTNEETHDFRAQSVARLCGSGKKRILDLGCGSGRTAAKLADMGHDVIGVELNLRDVDYANELLSASRRGTLTFQQGDYYTVEFAGHFDIVTWWQGFGLGSDADQRRMLRRIAREWLKPNGCALVDVYNPSCPARHAGTEEQLPPLPGVPGSVEMIERCHYDAVNARWIDEWQPTEAPENALAQAIRCYSPADLLLLLEGTVLKLEHIEVEGQALHLGGGSVELSTRMRDAWLYLVKMSVDGDE
jgi:Methyltransferase domain